MVFQYVPLDYNSDYDLKMKFRALCLGYYKKNHPDESDISLSSVSVGSIFRSTNAINCQVRFLNNSCIFLCHYIRETMEIMIEQYDLTDIGKGGVFINDDGNEAVGLCDVNMNIEEIILERKAKNNSKTQVKRKVMKKRKAIKGGN